MMAFIFVPNAEGGFDEGDRQTNPDTGVEYIYVDGAWRPLGPKIDEQFDTLDERYVNTSGDTLHGTLMFDRGENTEPNLLISPNVGNTSTNIYTLNNGALRFRSVPGNSLTDNSTTHITLGKDGLSGGPETYVYHVVEPREDLWAANKKYVDDEVTGAKEYTDQQIADIDLGDIDLDRYLPLSGGTMTGRLDINQTGNHQSLNVYEDGGLRVSVWKTGNIDLYGGTVTSNGLYKSTRKTGYALEVKPDDVTRAYLHTDGSLLLRPTQTGTDKGFSVWAAGLDTSNGKCAFKVQGDGRVRAGHSNAEAFLATEGSDVITKKYVDNNLVTITDNQEITGIKTMGGSHVSSTVSVNLKGRLQINGTSGSKGQVFISGGSGGINSWRNIVTNNSNDASNGSFYEANGALFYRTY